MALQIVDGGYASTLLLSVWHRPAKVAELADAPDLGSGGREVMGVRVPPFRTIVTRTTHVNTNADGIRGRYRR